MQATPEVEQWVAAPWMLRNEYFSPDIRFFTCTLQQKLNWLPSKEQQAEWFSTNLIRAEKRWPRYQNWLFKQLKSNPPDLLHAHFGPVGWQYLEMAEQLNIPLLTSFYGFDFARLPYQKPVYRERYQKLFQAAAAITTTGELTPELLKKQGCPAHKITSIPLSIKDSSFPFIKREKCPGRLRLLQVATFTEKKGHLDTLAALKIALENCPDIHLTMAGERQDKKLFQQIQHFIQSNDLQAHVKLLEFLPHAQLAQFMGQFEVFIHPSCTAKNKDCEGAPVVILEAMATGLPVISTLHSDIPKQVLHGKTGFLAPERNPGMLATYLEQFYQMDNADYQAMSRAAAAHVREKFEVKLAGQKIRTLYQSALDQKALPLIVNS